MSLPVKEIIEWDVPNWSQLIPAWTPVLNSLGKNSKVLAVGERNGGLSMWLALQGFDVICTDRTGPRPEASLLHKKYNVNDKIEYADLDIVDCDWEKEQFDLIIAKSVIGGLKADPADRTTRNFFVQQKAVNNVHGLLKKGGYFLSAENMQGSFLMRRLRKSAKRDSGWRHLEWKEMTALYSSFSEVEMKAFGVLPTRLANSLLNETIFVINKYFLQILPDTTKYISFTVAKK